MEIMTLGQRLKSLRKQRNLSQAETGAAVGLTQTAYGRYETGQRDPDTITLAKLAQLFGVSVDYLMGMASQTDDPDVIPANVVPMKDMPYYYLPVVHGVKAGTPLYMEDNACVYVDSPRQADYAMTIEDDSMAPSYLAGDVVYIKQSGAVDDGTIAVVAVEDRCIIRRYYRIKSGVQLVSDDPRYAPMVFLGEESDEVRVLGVIVGFTRMYKK